MSLDPGRTNARVFRPEIQGLRAIGSLLVAIYHIWIERVSGGVDVFFVISGFLILGSLLSQAENGRSIDLARFATNLSIRLFPLALFVVVAVLAMTPLILPATRWHNVLIDAGASATYLENWRLAFRAVDYLNREEALSPFQHYWAMSIQGQFYLIFGLMIFAVVKYRPHFVRSDKLAVYIVAALLALSLLYSIYFTALRQPFTYFDTFARVWEFALGGLLAQLVAGPLASARLRIILGWVGLFAVLTCGMLLDVSTGFPGYMALWPTLGACLVIYAGQTGSRFGADRLLSSAVFTYLGRISYALYLWHWPVLVFYLSYANLYHAGALGGAVVLLASFVLASFSTWLVEGVWRLSRQAGVGRNARAIGAQLAIIATMIVAGYGFERRATASEQRIAVPSKLYPGATVSNSVHVATNSPILPSGIWAHKDRPKNMTSKCHQTFRGTAALTCKFGDPDATRLMVIVGGSHSAHWLTAMQGALRGEGWRIVTMTKSSCLFLLKDGSQVADPRQACAKWNKNAMAKILKLRPAVVFTTSTRAQRGREKIPLSWQATIGVLSRAGIPVLAIRDTPWMNFDVAECVTIKGADAIDCRRSRSAMLSSVNPAKYLKASDLIAHVDMSDRFCDDVWCYPVTGNVLMYFDKHHMTATYGKTIAPSLKARILPILKRFSERERPAGPGLILAPE